MSLLHSYGIDGLSRDERIVLVQELWNSIAGEPAPGELSNARRVELQRRAAIADQAPDDSIPWEEAKARILGRISS